MPRSASARSIFISIAFIICSSFFLQQAWYSDSHAPSDHILFNVQNDTLGFSKIFVVSLPERSDKRDAISIAASLTGIKFDWVEGVDGNLVPEKAMPMGWPGDASAHTLGCWRGHMNVAQKMVKERIASALILEDDADWDVTLKSQLVEFARGTSSLQESDGKTQQNNRENKVVLSPYGEDWDLLWVGHCGARNREDEDQNYYVIRDDPTAVPQDLWGWPRRQPNLTPAALQGENTRVVFTPVRGLCTFGYALSFRGAQRLLYHQSIAGFATASDRALQRACNDRFMGFNCIAPYPPLIGTHRAAGLTSKDSDRVDTTRVAGGSREVAQTAMIVFSTRLNYQKLINSDGKVKSQWPNRTKLPEMDQKTELPRGTMVWVSKSEYKDFPRPG